ncbi:helix-turn-helix domain-containing protein [Nocardia sp. NPDC050193]
MHPAVRGAAEPHRRVDRCREWERGGGPRRSGNPADRSRAAASHPGTASPGAGRLFAESGYECITTRAVAAAAETGPRLVMWCFGSKEELFARCR